MYEMQGPHVARHVADLLIPQPAFACLAIPPVRLAREGSGFPVLAEPLGSPPRWPADQVVSEFLLPAQRAAQGFPLTFSRFFCHPQAT
jgi:hypothetical protein